MPRISLADALNCISELFQIGMPPRGAIVLNGEDEDSLYLIEGSRERFELAVSELFESLTSVKGTISRDYLLTQVLPLIREKKVAGQGFDQADARRFQEKLSGLPLQTYKVLRPIHGVDLAPADAPVVFGAFKIDFRRNLLKSDKASLFLGGLLTQGQDDQLFIQCEVSAREKQIASELADAYFYRFELIFRFFLGRRTDWVEVGVVNYRGAQLRNRFICSDDGEPVEFSSAWHGAMQPFLLKDKRFPFPNDVSMRLFEMITNQNSDLERHIIRCAEWTGQAIAEPNEAAALVKAAIALEVLFSGSDKGVITASIMAQISESCAFVLGACGEPPLQIEQDVKRLYGIRSAVVHSGKDSVDSHSLDSFIRICRSVVYCLLSNPEFKGMDSLGKLYAYMKGKKYAGVGSDAD